MKIEQIMQNGEQFIPAFTLSFEQHACIAIQLKRTFMQQLIQQFISKRNELFVYSNEGQYKYLTVREYIQFYKEMNEMNTKTEILLTLFQLQQIANTKLKDLTHSELSYISVLRFYFAKQPIIILEEPFFYLEDIHRIQLKKVMEQSLERKKILVLTSNLEDALIVSEQIYRLDERGFHRLDILEESNQKQDVVEDGLKIQKIQTKRNDKVILFDPPEIDFIESVDGNIVISVDGEHYQCSYTLSELEGRLKHYGFYRCHRSYIVNLQKVREIITWTKNSYSLRLNISKDAVVPLSRSKIAELKELLSL